MAFDRNRAKELITNLLQVESIPCKRVHVGPLGSILCTFYGRASAEKAAELFQPFAGKLAVVEGYDPGIATDIRNGRRDEVRVYRVGGLMGAQGC